MSRVRWRTCAGRCGGGCGTHRVEGRDPPDEELARERVGDVDALAEQRHEAVDVEVLRLGDDVLHQPVDELHAVLHRDVGVGRQLEEAVEDRVEVRDGVAARDLRDVVQRLAAVVPHARVLVLEAREHRREQRRQHGGDVRRPEADRRPRERVQRALAQVGERRLGEVGRERLDQPGHLLELRRVAQLAREVLDLERRLLPLVVLLLAEVAERGGGEGARH